MSYFPWLLLAGFAVGLTTGLLIKTLRAKSNRELAEELFRQQTQLQSGQMNTIIDHLKASFGQLSLEALSQSTSEFIKLAQARLATEREMGRRDLDEKKGLIDQQLSRLNGELESLAAAMQEFEKDRAQKYGELASQLRHATAQTQLLMQTTATLREALVNTKARGQWGERMAEDVLRMAGFIENINYRKQKAIEGSRSRPDYTFILPRNLMLNMDVKFPLDNYLRFLETTSESDRARYLSGFLRDVRQRIKEVTSRDYINQEQNTVDYVLLFIPNEQIYAFVQEQDPALLDTSLQQRVILCSPMTLFAILAVVRQAIDNFALENTSREIMSLLGSFRKQWEEFGKKLDSLGKSLNSAMNDYELLTTTRRRQLETPLNKIEELRGRQQGENLAKQGEPAVDEISEIP